MIKKIDFFDQEFKTTYLFVEQELRVQIYSISVFTRMFRFLGEIVSEKTPKWMIRALEDLDLHV